MNPKQSGVIISDETKRVLQVIDLLKALKIVKSDKEFSTKIDWQNQNLSSVRKGSRNFPDLKLFDISKAYHINHSYFKTGLLPVFNEKSEFGRFNSEIKKSDFLRGLVTDYKKPAPAENRMKETPRKMTANAKLLGDLYEGEEFGEGTKFRQISPGIFRMKVPLVSQKARNGFLAGFSDPEYLDELPTTEITVDFYHKGTYLCFETEGDSMDDGTIKSIPDKTKVTCRFLPKDQWKPRLYVHKFPNWVFVHKTDGILCKQIADQNLEEGWVILHALNPNKELYPDQKYELKDILAIYNVVKRELPD